MRIFTCFVLMFVRAGCTSVQRNPVPLDQMDMAQIPNIPNARHWGDVPPKNLQQMIDELAKQRAASDIKDLVTLSVQVR